MGWLGVWYSYRSVGVVDHGVVRVGGEEGTVGRGEGEEVVDVLVNGGFEGNEAGGEIGDAEAGEYSPAEAQGRRG